MAAAQVKLCGHYLVENLKVSKLPLKFVLKKPNPAVVTLHAPNADSKGMVQCTVEATRGASSTISKMLENLSAGKLECKPNEIAIAIDKDPSVPSNQGTLTQGVPTALDSFSKQVLREFSDIARRTVQVARWRVNAHGTHRTICGGKGVGYSLDGKAWFTLPQDINFSMDVAATLSLHDDQFGEVELLLESGEDEPIAHQLFREALENRFPNPRSALILAVTSIETGVKNCVSRLVPEATWLVENAPTPPVVNMLRDFLPKLSKTRARTIPHCGCLQRCWIS